MYLYFRRKHNDDLVTLSEIIASTIYDRCNYSPKTEKAKRFLEGIILYHLNQINSYTMPVNPSIIRKIEKDMVTDVQKIQPNCDSYSAVFLTIKKVINCWAEEHKQKVNEDWLHRATKI